MAAERVDVRTAREMQRAGDAIIDVRSQAEYCTGHIPGSVNIPIDLLPVRALPAGQLITTCSTGRRGERAADLLDRLGRVAFHLGGGTKAWSAAGLPLVRGAT
jgi:rhodanese-related sulfurtransferase